MCVFKCYGVIGHQLVNCARQRNHYSSVICNCGNYSYEGHQQVSKKGLLYMTLVFYFNFHNKTSVAEASPLNDMYRQWLHKDDHTLHAVFPEMHHEWEKDLTSEVIDVEVIVGDLMLEVRIDGKQIIHMFSQVEGSTQQAIHKGVTMVVAHPRGGSVMRIASFHTGEPRTSQGLVEMLNSLQAGRLLILAAPGDWKTHVSEDVNDFLEEYLGGWWVRDVCYGEMWVGIGTVDGPLWAEAATTLSNYTLRRTSKPLHVAASVPKATYDMRCGWYNRSELADRLYFCETYEGYGELCDCKSSEVITPKHSPLLEMREEIPVVIATARQQFNVYKQIHQLWSQPGGANTPIFLSVDGLQEEARDFAKVLGLPVVFHKNPAATNTIARISEHIKFSIVQGFKLHPNASKLIILEDDLLLSPDFISYFHQTAPLLDADKSIFCISAFNYNSFSPTAVETSRLYRENVIPAFGWMLTRDMSHELIPIWPPLGFVADWDVYLKEMIQKGRSVITPEVPRAFHNGHGGLHVNGWEQAVHYDPRPLNMDPLAKVNISYLTSTAYEVFLENELKSAIVLRIKEHPCLREYIPKEKVGSFVVYYGGGSEMDNDSGYYILSTCFNGYEQRQMQHHRLMHTIGYYGNAVYIISCPESPYCNIKMEDYEDIVYTPTAADLRVMLAFQNHRLRQYVMLQIPVRHVPRTLKEEVTMQNTAIEESSLESPEVIEIRKSVFHDLL